MTLYKKEPVKLPFYTFSWNNNMREYSKYFECGKMVTIILHESGYYSNDVSTWFDGDTLPDDAVSIEESEYLTHLNAFIESITNP